MAWWWPVSTRVGATGHQPIMACHHGYTPQHAIFVLCYLAVVAKLNASRNAALEIRVVGSACSLAAIVYHLVLAAACESPSVSMRLVG